MLLCTCSLAAAAASTTTATEPAADIRNWVAQSRTPPKQSSATQLQDLQALQPLAAALGSAFAKVDGSDFASAAAKVLDGDDVGTYVRSQFEAKSGLTSAWLDGFFNKDGGHAFRTATSEMRKASHWNGVHGMSDRQLWDALFSESPPWANDASVPCDACLLCDHWSRVTYYKCLYASDDFVPSIERAAMGTNGDYWYPMQFNYWRGMETFGQLGRVKYIPWLEALPAGNGGCISRSQSLSAELATQLGSARNFKRGLTQYEAHKKGHTVSDEDTRKGIRLVGPGFFFVAIEVPPMGVRGGSAWVERYVDTAESSQQNLDYDAHVAKEGLMKGLGIGMDIDADPARRNGGSV